MENYYDATSKNYDELYGEEQLKKIAFIKQHITIPDDYFVLDVGCGSGVSSALAANVAGIDPSVELVKLANKKNITAICASAEDIPFEDKHFDAVISLTAIQNFYDIKKSLEEIKRVGKKLFILTILKRSEKTDKTRQLISEIFSDYNIKELEEEKDIIFIIK
ncbi:MAG: class I SAM-dependent methyltransferase [Candidatus Woesearchaeota archaeon]|jgi:ubiquinone/menaquinone biosynthesis C-methylase UbiE